MKNTLLVGFFLALSLAAVLVSTPFSSDRVRSQSIRAPEVPVRIVAPIVPTGTSIRAIDPIPQVNATVPQVNTTVPSVAIPEARSAPQPVAVRARVGAVAIGPGPGPRAEPDSPDCSVHEFTCAQACDPSPTGWSSYRQCLRYQCKQVDESCLERLVHQLESRGTDNEVNFSIACDYPYKIQIEFYSQNRSVAWPGNDMAYTISDDNTHVYTLKCKSGENICYGAWPKNSVYWGVGLNDRYNCQHCCAVCDGRSVSFTLH
jgi:hypothetical protein